MRFSTYKRQGFYSVLDIPVPISFDDEWTAQVLTGKQCSVVYQHEHIQIICE